MANLGKYAFIAGVVLSIISAFGISQPWFGWVLAVLGIIVGVLNISGRESRTFLIAAIGLMLSASSIQQVPFVGGVISDIVAYLIVFIAPAVLVVAMRSLLEAANN